jgi:VWFA-related protein
MLGWGSFAMSRFAESRALKSASLPQFARATSLFVSALLAFGSGSPLFGQQDSKTPEPKISVQSNIVTVSAIVRDKHGQIISDLTKNDFTLDEDGRPQSITYFARQNDLPLAVGLLVDTSMSQRRVLDQERTASSTFVDHTLREEKKDQAFLIHFDREVELLEDFTSSRKKLEAALDQLETPEMQNANSGGGGGGGQGGGAGGAGGGGGHHHGGGGGGTLLYDAVYLASNDMMSKLQGRKAVIVLSDGVDHGSKESLGSAIESAQRANTIVYSILFKDDEPFGSHGGSGGGGGWGGRGGMGGGGRRYPQQEQRPDGKKILERISKETGGRLFEVTKKQTVDQIYEQIQQELRDQYILGYVPDKSPSSADYRKIHLVTAKKDLVVQARDGYYAAQPASAAGSQ